MSAQERLLVLLGFHLTRDPSFGLADIQAVLETAKTFADESTSPADLKQKLLQRSAEIHHQRRQLQLSHA